MITQHTFDTALNAVERCVHADQPCLARGQFVRKTETQKLRSCSEQALINRSSSAVGGTTSDPRANSVG